MFPRTYSIALVILGLLGAGADVAHAQAKAKRPNILIFLSDDVGYAEYGFQGSKDVPTPHIDSIAKNGVRFTQGYVSGPYCSPTRAGLMTGRYQTRFGHEFNGQGPNFGLPLSEQTIADVLKSLGYATCCIGKWHLGNEMQFRATKRGFDEFYGTLANTPFFKPSNFVDSRITDEVRPIEDPDFYTTDAYAARAVDWLEKNKDRPWFLYMPFNAQHAPLEATKKYLDRFAGIQDEKRRTFAAMMSAMDDAVGRVLAKIAELGQDDNTLIIFFSDNGGPTSQTSSRNDPLRGFKATTLEGGVRVPFCMQWKGKLPAGKVYDQPIIQLDLLPTCVAAAGGKLDPARKLDGVNLLPYLTDEKQSRPHDELYWRFGEQWAVRKGDFKLVVSKIDGPEARLFNLAADIGEANDLSAKNPEKAKELKTLYDAWNAEQAKPLWQPNQNKKKDKKKDKEIELTKTNIFEAGVDGYKLYRIPGIVATAKGMLLAYCEARKSDKGDWGHIDIVMRRSSDGGATWEPARKIVTPPKDAERNPAALKQNLGKPGEITANNPVAIVDRKTGAVHFLYCIEYGRCFYQRSDDDGKTFTQPMEITSTFDKFRPDYKWQVLATGPGHGIQLSSGRLLVPVWLSDGSGGHAHRPSCVSVIYSDDHGKSWQRGDIVVAPPEPVNPSETVAVELADGRVMLNFRHESPIRLRGVVTSKDGVSAWSTPRYDPELPEPICMASIVRLSQQPAAKNAILFANPDNPKDRARRNLTVRVSHDEGQTWAFSKAIEPGPSGYSDLAVGPDRSIYCFYERGAADTQYQTRFLCVAKFTEDWITSP